ncbi:MAG: bifunctional phosphoribosyl-AMP cyclohydrolase/phosphoribosyl-ATP diphosphatase HisIE [Eubacterium sp.]|nr:bifunctional phosphoribosyl-AMP cyclohydrolase/phosphoribosyl-ATP diphosphatase HisIE [Eubacterium sp.]
MERVNIDDIRFDENGLIPAIVQDHETGRVLTLAYMNKESLKKTIETGETVFWSRSRQELWHKGETSGNFQHVVSVTADCDRDALVVSVIKDGPACHLGTESCFEYPVEGSWEPDMGFGGADDAGFKLEDLYALLVDRKEKMPEGSYTSYLFEKGIDKILKKVGEESTEVIIASKAGDKPETVYEIADLAYHVLVMMVEMGISVEEVRDELASRHVIDHKVKQEHMTGE